MKNFRTRTTTIQRLAERFVAQAPALIDTLVADHRFARGAAPRHVQEALAYLLTWPANDAAVVNEAVRKGLQEASGPVSILLHEDAPLTSFARTVPAAVLAGSPEVLVNVPPGARTTGALLSTICQDLPGVTVQSEPAGSFLFRALTDNRTGTVWAGGATDLLAPFGALIRETQSRVIFEGLGNDAVVVGDEASVHAAAKATALLAFRDGGLDPASPKRVYIPESSHDTFCEALGSYAASHTIETYTDASCTVSPIRSDATRDHIQSLIEDACTSGAHVVTGGDFRRFDGQDQPTLCPTVVGRCAPDIRLVAEGCRGPVVAVVPYADAEELFRMLDGAASPDGQAGSAVTLIGGAPIHDALADRFTYVFDDSGPHATAAREARLYWGGGPRSWTFMGHAADLEPRYGPVDLTDAFSSTVESAPVPWRGPAEGAAAAR